MYERAIDIKLERLTLARAHPCDLYATYEIMSDPETMHYCSTIPHQSCGQTATWFERIITPDREQGDEFILEYQCKIIGKLGVWRLSEVGVCVGRFDLAMACNVVRVRQSNADPDRLRKLLRASGCQTYSGKRQKSERQKKGGIARATLSFGYQQRERSSSDKEC